jgi:hypothetical protein
MSPTAELNSGTTQSSGTVIVNAAPITFTFSAYVVDTKQITLSSNTTYYATMRATFVGSSGNNVRIY